MQQTDSTMAIDFTSGWNFDNGDEKGDLTNSEMTMGHSPSQCDSFHTLVFGEAATCRTRIKAAKNSQFQKGIPWFMLDQIEGIKVNAYMS